MCLVSFSVGQYFSIFYEYRDISSDNILYISWDIEISYSNILLHTPIL